MKIIDLSTGIQYDSIAAAAAATSVDASNLRKVLQGKRKSAGGRMFATADTELSARKVADLQRVAQWELSERERKRQQTYAKKHDQKVRQQQAARKKKQTRAQKQTQTQTRKAAYEAMRKANEYIRKQTAKDSSKASLADLQALAQQIGARKHKPGEVSLFNLSPKTLAGKSEQELQQIAAQVSKYINDDLKRRQQYAEIRAAQYHITVEEAASEDMMDAIDNLTKQFERLRQWFPNPEGYRYSGRFKYREIYDDLIVDAQSMTAEQIQRLADDLNAWMNEKRQKQEDELKDIYANWKASVYQSDKEEGGEDDDYKPISVRWD